MIVHSMNTVVMEKIQSANQHVFWAHGVKVTLLREHPETIPILVDWLYDDWSGYDKTLTKDKLFAGFYSRAQNQSIPLTLVAMKKKKPVAVISLKPKSEPEFEEYPDDSLWTGTVHVVPEERKKGLGTSMLRLAKDIAAELGYHEMFTFLSDPEVIPWYMDTVGAEVVEERIYHDHKITILKTPLKK